MHFSVLVIGEDVENILAPYDMSGFNDEGDAEDYFYRTPEWDWYVIGGRYSDRIPLKDGSTTNSAIVSDIDFDKMIKDGNMDAYAVVNEEVWSNNDVDGEVFYDRYIDGLPSDETLTIVDCHY